MVRASPCLRWAGPAEGLAQLGLPVSCCWSQGQGIARWDFGRSQEAPESVLTHSSVSRPLAGVQGTFSDMWPQDGCSRALGEEPCAACLSRLDQRCDLKSPVESVGLA